LGSCFLKESQSMSCVLRLEGSEQLLREAQAIFQRATPPQRCTTGSFVNIPVSDADFSNLSQQISDARNFLEVNGASIAALTWRTALLDFGVERRDVAAQSETFPAELLRLAGNLGISLAVSLYAAVEERA
jgi:hypothetical protein